MSPVDMLALALRALRAARRRGVIVGGTSKLHEVGARLLAGSLREELGAQESDELRAFASEQVVFVDDAPYGWLLRRSTAVVHQGGAWLTHEAVRAACPAVISPMEFCGDQRYFAEQVGRIGAGVGFPKAQLKDIGPEALAGAIKEAERLRPRLPHLAKRMCKERGAAAAADEIQAFLAGR